MLTAQTTAGCMCLIHCSANCTPCFPASQRASNNSSHSAWGLPSRQGGSRPFVSLKSCMTVELRSAHASDVYLATYGCDIANQLTEGEASEQRAVPAFDHSAATHTQPSLEHQQSRLVETGRGTAKERRW